MTIVDLFSLTSNVQTELPCSVVTVAFHLPCNFARSSFRSLSAASQTGEEFFKGECDFKLEQHGSFKAYTYFNLKNLTGGRERATPLAEGKTKSSIYKLDADTFTTSGGFRTGDDDKPMLIKWEKVPEAKK